MIERERQYEKRLNCKELAAALGYHPTYVSAMRRAGFVMPQGRATAREARKWLRKHPAFRRRFKIRE